MVLLIYLSILSHAYRKIFKSLEFKKLLDIIESSWTTLHRCTPYLGNQSSDSGWTMKANRFYWSVGAPKNVALGLCVWCTWTPPTKKKQCNQLKIPLTFFDQNIEIWGGCTMLLLLSLSLSLSWVWCLFGSYWITARGVLLITSTTSSSTSAQAPWSHPESGHRCAMMFCSLMSRMNQLLPMKHPRAIALQLTKRYGVRSDDSADMDGFLGGSLAPGWDSERCQHGRKVNRLLWQSSLAIENPLWLQENHR